MHANTTCWIVIELNLNQELERLIGGGCFPDCRRDHSVHGFDRNLQDGGQTLEQVPELLLSQIDEIESGNFSDWMIDAIVSDFKSNHQTTKYETNRGRADQFVEAFILDIPMEKYQKQLKELENANETTNC